MQIKVNELLRKLENDLRTNPAILSDIIEQIHGQSNVYGKRYFKNGGSKRIAGRKIMDYYPLPRRLRQQEHQNRLSLV